MKHRFTRGLMAIGAVAALALTACSSGNTPTSGSSEGGDVTLDIVWWGNDDRAARYNEAIDLFEEANPTITVNANFSDWSGYWTARATEAAGRSLPDVMQMDLSYLAEYSENGQLLDLATYTGDGTIDLSGFDENLVASGALNGQQVGIPTSTNTLATFINTDLVAKTGVAEPGVDFTWDQYFTFIKDVSAAGEETDGHKVYGGGDTAGTFWFFLQWLAQQGIEPFAEDGTFQFTQEQIVEYLNLTADLRSDDAVFPAERGEQLAPLDGFSAEEQASAMTWDNFLAGYSAEVTTPITMLPVPTGDSGEKAMFWKPSMLLSAGANTEHPKEAAMLIDFLLTEPEVGAIFGTSKGVPADQAQRDAMNLEEGSVDSQVTAFEEEMAQYVTAPTPRSIKGFGPIESEWLRLGGELGYGNVTPEQFAEQWWTEAEMATQ